MLFINIHLLFMSPRCTRAVQISRPSRAPASYTQGRGVVFEGRARALTCYAAMPRACYGVSQLEHLQAKVSREEPKVSCARVRCAKGPLAVAGTAPLASA